MTIADLFERARQVPAADVARAHLVKLSSRGAKARGVCPLCSGGVKSKSEPFAADVKGPLWYCFGCGAGGDSIKLEQLLGAHAGAAEAAAAILGEDLDGARPRGERMMTTPMVRAAAPVDEWPVVDGQAVADWIRATCLPARGTPVENWLSSRGLKIDRMGAALDRLRWHPRVPVAAWRVRGADDARRPPASVMTCGAMVAPLTRWDAAGDHIGAPAGVHVTFLAPGGYAKAVLPRADGSLRPSRKMFGETHGAGFALTAVDPLIGTPLLVGEGIETTWAFAQVAGGSGRVRAVATLSLGNLEGGVLKDEAGAFRLDVPIADPDKPPLLIARPGAVVVMVDADMAPVERLVRIGRLGKPEKRWLSALERAELCGALAAQHWARAGATSVRVLRPRVGRDFNDSLMESL